MIIEEQKDQFEIKLKKLENERDKHISNEKHLVAKLEDLEELTSKINKSIIDDEYKELFNLLKTGIYERRLEIHVKIQKENKKIVRQRKKYIKFLNGIDKKKSPKK